MPDYDALREELVREGIERWGYVKDRAVIAAMRKVPRHLFVPENLRFAAYENRPLPIGEGQTISEPLIVGMMLDLLRVRPDDRVLDIGAGSGYQTALLAEIAGEVYGIERVAVLAERAAAVLSELGYSNAHIVNADGTLGHPEAAPYDRIIVGAGSPDVPEPLTDQLADNGRLIMPIGTMEIQRLVVVEKSEGVVRRSYFTECFFVPLIGEHGWREYR